MTYTPHTWVTDETITADRLNAIENALGGAVDPLSLAPIARSGQYADLTGTPPLKPIATSGAWSDLTGTPAPYTDAAAVSAVVSATTVTPSGAWNFTQTPKVNGVAIGSGGGGTNKNTAADLIVYVATSGSDSNDGLSWSSAKATVSAGLALLSGGAGTVMIGAGSYNVTGLAPNGQSLQGAGQGATILKLNTTGSSLLNLNGTVGSTFRDITFTFAATSVTGTLANLSNAFVCTFERCTFLGLGTIGQGVSGQVGIHFSNNAGDSFFNHCTINNLYTGVFAETVVNYFDGCVFSGNRTAMTGGDAAGNPSNGLMVRGSTFAEVGDFYVNITGGAQSWAFDTCWFDGSATTAIQVGGASNGFGPWLFSLTNCTGIAGATKSLVLNASDFTLIEACTFTNGGTNPTPLTVNAANCPYGRIGVHNETQGGNLDQIVPVTWNGATRKVTSADGTMTALQTFQTTRAADYSPLVHKRVLVNVATRSSGATVQTVNFPASFAAVAKVADSTGKVTTFSASSFTMPAGASAAGVILFEGF